MKKTKKISNQMEIVKFIIKKDNKKDEPIERVIITKEPINSNVYANINGDKIQLMVETVSGMKRYISNIDPIQFKQLQELGEDASPRRIKEILPNISNDDAILISTSIIQGLSRDDKIFKIN
ncbi:MAG: hypothetical protein ACTSRP_06400 [Candidatus Helarchaeota archaeon]